MSTAEYVVDPDMLKRIIALRRDLHRHPELAWQEHWTASRIEQELRELGLEPRRIADTGLVVDLQGSGTAGRVALRVDTDGLPIQEQTDLGFASERPGCMHACGHDGHASMLVGTAALLQARPAACSVRLLWQPAEEIGAGASRLIEAGALDQVDMIFGAHLDTRYPTGTLVVADGPVNASTDTFHIRIQGVQGHGARPHQCVDAILVGGSLVTQLQSLVSREIDPGNAVVVSIGTFQAGVASNVIAGEAVLTGTIRTRKPQVRHQVLDALTRITEGVAHLHRATVCLTVSPGTPVLVNGEPALSIARLAAEEVASDVPHALRSVNLGGEDFACYLEHVPGCYIRVGAEEKGVCAGHAHAPDFDFDEGALAIGAAWFYRVAHRAASVFEASTGRVPRDA